MAQQGWQPGQPLHIKPIIIRGGADQPQGLGQGGGYIGSGNGWGPQEGPRRGEGGPSRINYLNFPSIVDDLLGELESQPTVNGGRVQRTICHDHS